MATPFTFGVPPVLPSLASAPGSPMNGMAYYDTTLSVYRIYTGGAWLSLTQNFAIPVTIATPIVSTITIIGIVQNPLTLTGVKRAKTAAGTVTCSLKVNGSTTVSGFPTSITTSSTDYTISQALAVNDSVQFVISAVSGTPSLAEFSLIGVRN